MKIVLRLYVGVYIADEIYVYHYNFKRQRTWQ